MATIRVKFCPSPNADREGCIYYQIIHEKSVRRINSVYTLHNDDWDSERGRVRYDEKGYAPEMRKVIRRGIRHDVERLKRITRKFEDADAPYTATDIYEEYERYVADNSLFLFMENIIDDLKEQGRIRTAETYSATVNSFKKYLKERHPVSNGGFEDDIHLDYITPDLMEGYEGWGRRNGLVPNTISFYTRILRAVYNRAVDNGLVDNCNPFRHVYTGIDKTKKRALTLSALRKIKALRIEPSTPIGFARDMFLMSFYLRGMSFVDMSYLRKSDLIDGRLTYHRRKTGQRLSIRWTSEMQQLLDRYPENPTDYLLPIINNIGKNDRSLYRNACYNINHNLKHVAEMAGVKERLTMYVARHSWASAARSKGIPLSIISEGMGHDSELTTRIYLASLDTSMVDRANAIIIKSI